MNKGVKIALWIVGIAIVIWAIWYFTKPKKAASAGRFTPTGMSQPSDVSSANQTTTTAGTI